MNERVLRHFGLTEADRLGSGWESSIYALGPSQILRIPNPEPAAEVRVRARAAFTSGLPDLPFEVPRVREITYVDSVLVAIEDRISGRALDELLPDLMGEPRRRALAAYLETAEVMQTVKAEGDYGDLLLPESLRCAHWGEYLARRLDAFADDAVLAANVPGYGEKVARLRAQVLALPDPEKCIVHGDIWPPNVMMDDALRVTGLLDFSFTTRIGDGVMDLAGALHFNRIGNPRAAEDFDYLTGLVRARHGAELQDLIGLYAVWFAFSFAYAHENRVVFPWCLEMIRAY